MARHVEVETVSAPADLVAVRRTAVSPSTRVVEWVTAQPQVEALRVFALSRVLILLVTYFGLILYSQVFQSPHPSMLHSLFPAWNRWDTVWYTDIARQGYAWHRPGVATQPSAFFPLYPLLVHLGAVVTHRSYLVVALLISNLAFLAALLYLWRLAAWEVGDRAVAGRTLLYVAVFPTAFFFFAGYTESLFLFLTVATFYHMRRRDWLLAGAFGALASATRVTGALLIVPFAYEYLRARSFSLRRIDWRVTGLLLVPAGLLAFMLYLHATVGDALAFSHNQSAWQKVVTPRLWAGFLESLRQIVSVQPSASFFEAHNILEVGLGGLFLLLSFLAARRLPAAYALYLAAFWIVTLSSPALAAGYPVPLVSLSRYVLSLFPVFIYLGMVGRSRALNEAYLVLSAALLSLLTVQFIHGGWVV